MMIVLLTGTIDPKGCINTKRMNVNERTKDYYLNIKKFLSETDLEIVFVENSNSPLGVISKFNEEKRVEIIQFDGNNYDRNLGKGYGEVGIINHAIDKSQKISTVNYILKITGRYYFNFNKIKQYLENEYILYSKETNLLREWAFTGFFKVPKGFWISEMSKLAISDIPGNYIENWFARKVSNKSITYIDDIGISGISGTWNRKIIMKSFPGKGICQRACQAAGRVAARTAATFRRCDISIFHEFVPPPSGGGNQFLRALKREWERRGFSVEVNTVSGTTRACLLNSFNFDANRFRFLRLEGCRTVHRVDGPLAVYRGMDDGTDRKIAEWNREFAQRTVMQSRFSLQTHTEMGLTFRDPVVIPNAADPEIFFAPERPTNLGGRKLRVISTSWSDNRNKGADVYEWLDRNLDFGRVEYTFVGRLSSKMENIRVIPPMASRELAELVRGHDVYLTASKNDPCSNSLIEALSCGLPAVYLKSGGHPEIVGDAGLGFKTAEEIPALLERMAEELGAFRGKIRVPKIEDVADRYLAVLGLSGEAPR